MGMGAEAAAHAAYVANRWTSVDHDEAMELWNSVPTTQRPAEGPSDSMSTDTLSAEGIVKSVSCDAKAMTLTLDQSGKPAVFNLKGAEGGFADTLWVGRDHFTPCFHVTGLRAVVRYKTGVDKSSIGDVVSWAYRDDLPPPTATAETAQHN
jgi:hypothetical protein